MDYRDLQFSDASDHDSSDDGWHQHYRQLGGGRYHGLMRLLILPGVSILREKINVAVAQDSESPAGRISILFPLSAEGGWRVNGHHETAPVVALRFGRTDLFSVVGGESDLLAVSIDHRLLPEGQGAQGTASIPRDRAALDLTAWLEALLAYGASGGPPSADLDRLLPELLAERLGALALRANQRAGSGRLAGPFRWPSSYDLFRRVTRLLAEDPGEPMTLAGLSRRLAVPADRLRLAFHDTVGVGPAAWLRCARLNGARRALLAGRASDSVSSIAMTWGFFHLGRFSADYRRQFGEAPSVTLGRRVPRRERQTGAEAPV